MCCEQFLHTKENSVKTARGQRLIRRRHPAAPTLLVRAAEMLQRTHHKLVQGTCSNSANLASPLRQPVLVQPPLRSGLPLIFPMPGHAVEREEDRVPINQLHLDGIRTGCNPPHNVADVEVAMDDPCLTNRSDRLFTAFTYMQATAISFGNAL